MSPHLVEGGVDICHDAAQDTPDYKLTVVSFDLNLVRKEKYDPFAVTNRSHGVS